MATLNAPSPSLAIQNIRPRDFPRSAHGLPPHSRVGRGIKATGASSQALGSRQVKAISDLLLQVSAMPGNASTITRAKAGCLQLSFSRSRGLTSYGGHIKVYAELGTSEKESAEPAVDRTPVLNFPTLIFPKTAFAWQKAAPKESLKELPHPQADSAQGWILNLVELAHWTPFPLTFYITYFIFCHADAIAPSLPGGVDGVFFLVLGHLAQIFGGIPANMMHEYEGWQQAPFQNPVGLSLIEDTERKDVVDALRIDHFNNTWLRTVMYQFLLTFQGFGLGCVSLAVFGPSTLTGGLILGSAAIAILGPKEPRMNITTALVPGLQHLQPPRPILPFSWSLAIVYFINFSVNVAASYALFNGPITTALDHTALPLLSSIPSWAGGAGLAISGPVLIAFGGGWEGFFAESTFWQWHHFIAVFLMNVGLCCLGVAYWYLVNVP